MNAEHSPPAVARHVDQLDNIEELDRVLQTEELDFLESAPDDREPPVSSRTRRRPIAQKLRRGPYISTDALSTQSRADNGPRAEPRASVSRQTIPLTPRRARPRRNRVIAAEGYAGAWLEHVREQNVALWHPDELPEAECRSIAKSCANYSLRQFSEADYSAIQTQRNALVLESGLQKSGSQLSYDCRFLLRRATIVGPKAPTHRPLCLSSKMARHGSIASL